MRLSVSFVAFACLTGCCAPGIDTIKEGERLMEISREWSKSAARDDIEKTLSYWAKDAVILSSGNPPLQGKAAIRTMVENTWKMPGSKISWEPVDVDVSASGDMAYLIEENQLITKDSLGNPLIKFGRSVTIWKKEKDGIWKTIVGFTNDNSVQK